MIRPVTEDDIKPLVALTKATGAFKPLEVDILRSVFRDYFDGDIEAGHVAACLERDGSLLGFVYFAPDEITFGTWELWWIVVGKDAQGRGVGRELLRYTENAVRAAGGVRLYIDTGSGNGYEATRQFYLRGGYDQVAVLPDYFDEGDDKVVFRKSLIGRDK